MRRLYKKFTINLESILHLLSDFKPMHAYIFLKPKELVEATNLQNILPSGYTCSLKDKIESIVLIYSGNTVGQKLITTVIGRKDTHRKEKKFDIDVFNIYPKIDSNEEYIKYQWLHFKDDKGKRVSLDNNPREKLIINGITPITFEQYSTRWPQFFNLHTQSFGYLKSEGYY